VHPDPQCLFDQADALIAGQLNETDLRRAVSSAYYGVFHCVLRHVADTVLGAGNRGTNLYRAVYSGIAHEQLRTVCHKLGGPKPDDKIVKGHAPNGGFGQIIIFATLTLNLQDQRKYADYNPVRPFLSPTAAAEAVTNARDAVKYFEEARPEQRGAFIALLAMKLRNES